MKTRTWILILAAAALISILRRQQGQVTGIQIHLGFIPEERRTGAHGAVADEQPQRADALEALGDEVELQRFLGGALQVETTVAALQPASQQLLNLLHHIFERLGQGDAWLCLQRAAELPAGRIKQLRVALACLHVAGVDGKHLARRKKDGIAAQVALRHGGDAQAFLLAVRAEAEAELGAAQGCLCPLQRGPDFRMRCCSCAARGEAGEVACAENAQQILPQAFLLGPDLRQIAPAAAAPPLADSVAELHEVAFAGVVATHDDVDTGDKMERLCVLKHRHSLHRQFAYHIALYSTI